MAIGYWLLALMLAIACCLFTGCAKDKTSSGPMVTVTPDWGTPLSASDVKEGISVRCKFTVGDPPNETTKVRFKHYFYDPNGDPVAYKWESYIKDSKGLRLISPDPFQIDPNDSLDTKDDGLITDCNCGSAVIWTVPSGSSGPFVVKVTASDGKFSNSLSFPVDDIATVDIEAFSIDAITDDSEPSDSNC